ncbi:helix-turn-helix transcriptional regulator [Cellulosimicrobium arenosum]|uniref:Helix-turn-helix transcriptional regulator n=1 Tax=Cellulosimicrobium arenosum TaxID=2708133 RepID=A0A927PFI3_9MICO|nr:helix-turn-helix transcriptional regulator [Cellulosimicrobium arenosum]
MGIVSTQPIDGERLRFTDLQRRIAGISQRMQTRTVRNLERDALVTRTAPQSSP